MKSIFAGLIALTLTACGDDRWADYSYKMTVYVGDKAYSTVRHVKVEEGSTIQDSSGRRVDRSVEGEAVVIDTPSGPVFALMTPAEGDFGNGYYAAYVAEPALMANYGKPSEDIGPRYGEPGYDGLADDAVRHNAMLKVEGPRDLPRTIPNLDTARGPRDIVVWPMFERFYSLDRPDTVQKVKPESIGVTRITIAVTDEKPELTIIQSLPWLTELIENGGSVDGTRFPDNNDLKSNLGSGAFTQSR